MAERFERQDLSGAVLDSVNLDGALLHNASMERIVIRETTMAGAQIEADIAGVVVNGFRIDQLIDAEMDRLHPERARLKPTTANGFREALATLGDLRRRTGFGADLPGFDPYDMPPLFLQDAARARELDFERTIAFEDVVAAMEDRHRAMRERFAMLTDSVLGEPARGVETTRAGALRAYLLHEWEHHKVIERTLDSKA